jgi:hypothetical protein
MELVPKLNAQFSCSELCDSNVLGSSVAVDHGQNTPDLCNFYLPHRYELHPEDNVALEVYSTSGMRGRDAQLFTGNSVRVVKDLQLHEY